MTFADAIKAGFQNYVNFRGRAVRSEFWYWTLFTVLVGLVLSTLDSLVSGGGSTLSNVASIVFLLPNIAVSVRRFRDAGINPWLNLIQLLPLFLLIWVLVQFVAAAVGFPGLGTDAEITAALNQFQLTQDGPIAEFLTSGAITALITPVLITLGVSLLVVVFFLWVYTKPSVTDK